MSVVPPSEMGRMWSISRNRSLAHAHRAYRVFGFQRLAESSGDHAVAAGDGGDVVAVVDEHADRCIVEERECRGDGDGTDAFDLAAIARLGVAACERCAVDRHLAFGRLARPFRCQRH
jgi:hypothetical protein